MRGFSHLLGILRPRAHAAVLLLPVLAFLFVPGRAAAAGLTASDQASLKTIRKTVSALQADVRRLQKNALKPAAPVVAKWEELQQKVAPYTQGAGDLAFLLAYADRNYKENLDRLLLPYKWWRHQALGEPAPDVRPANPESEAFQAKLIVLLQTLPPLLEQLYERTHDDATLRQLLETTDDVTAEVQAEALWRLFRKDPATLMRVASSKGEWVARLESMLFLQHDAAPRAEWTGAMQRIADLSRNADQRVADVATRLRRYVEGLPAPA